MLFHEFFYLFFKVQLFGGNCFSVFSTKISLTISLAIIRHDGHEDKKCIIPNGTFLFINVHCMNLHLYTKCSPINFLFILLLIN